MENDKTQNPALSKTAVSDSAITIHKLKILPQYAELHLMDKKNWELRKNDRDFKIGDKIDFEIIDQPKSFLGHGFYRREIDYVFKGGEYGLEDGYCILSIS